MNNTLLKTIKKYKNNFYKLIRKIPNDIRSKKHLNEIRANRDPEENKNTKLPKKEKVNYRCLWIFEVYTPNYINNLISGIDKLPWDSSYSHDLKPSEVIRKSRESRYYSWYNLGFLGPRGKNDFENYIPEDVEYIYGSFFHYLPSTSIIGIQFVLKDSVSKIIEEIFKKEHFTYIKKVNKRFSLYSSPSNQKKEEIEKEKEEIFKRCCKWFKKYIPGLYSDKETNIEFPRCEFITLSKGKPYNKKRTLHEDYISILGLKREFDAWISKDLQGIFLEIPTLSTSNYSIIKISGNLKDITKGKDYEMYGGLESHGIERSLEDFNSTLVIWVLDVLLNNYRTILYRIRDSISNVNFKNIRKSTSKLEKIRKRLALIDRNILPFINEYKSLKKFIRKKSFCEFKPLEKNPFNKDIELIKSILNNSIEENKNMINEYDNVTRSINTTANIILSITNDRLFKKNLISQWIMIILTIFIFLLTAFTIIDKWQLILDSISSFLVNIKNFF